MTFDFDAPPDRRGTDSQKWQKFAGRDILPLWVADMDFQSPPAIREALRRRVDDGIFGYARPVKSTIEAVTTAVRDRYAWTIDPNWLVWLPGLVCGLNVAVRAFTEARDEVLCLTPVYPPFITAPQHQGRTAKTVPLALDSTAHRWQIDWDALERAVSPRTKLLLFCHPHNPVARVWQPEEVHRMGEFCVRHDLILCSDEIHCDLILDPAHGHTPTAKLTQEIAARTVTFMAPSKTYNVPGLGTSFAIISDQQLRARFVRATAGIVAEVNVLGYVACEAAYRDCEPWRQALLSYLRGNRDFLIDFIAREVPEISIEAPVEATYLAWMDVSRLGVKDPGMHFEACGVGLSDGAAFGMAPGGNVRLNFGCPRATLAEALRRIRGAAKQR